MVVKVADKEISTKERGSGQVVSLPYGMVVWSTGIGPRAEIMDFMKQIGQVCFAQNQNKLITFAQQFLFPIFTIFKTFCSDQNRLTGVHWLLMNG